MMRSTTKTTLCALSLFVLALLAGAPSAFADTPKQSGVADSASFDLTIVDPTHATLKLTQTWLGLRAAAMRQSLDAYFGNGDGRLSADEVAKVIKAASTDLRNQTYPDILLDGQPARVLDATITLDGAEANDTTTDFVVHHTVGLLTTMASGDNHTFTLTPVWNGTYSITLPTGEAFTGGQATQQGIMTAGTQIVSSFGPPVAVEPPVAPAPVSTAPAPSTPPPVTPQESSVPTKHGVPALPAVAILGALAGAAALIRVRRRG